ncbi:MAG: hypothetical protein NZ602_09500 [Thermoguttaceae bacterium]|nr:hypothetical protein [Thermoguttaceae bacterium]MDW8039076.1 hypothetical protein [Thermoguttaceae bacterium]
MGVIVILAGPLMEPATWQLITRGFWFGAGQEPPIDTRLAPPDKELDAEVVVFIPVESQAWASKILPAGFRQEPVLSRQQLELIQDDSLFRRAEREVWSRLLELLQETEESELQKRSEGLVTYGQLFRQSAAYRGRLVTVRGQLRRAEQVPMPSNSWGQQYYYQTWLQPVDQPSNPIQIYCLHLPEGFPLGLRIQEEVEVTGFYFKRVAYMAQDGLRTAPTLVAKTVRWLPRPKLRPDTPPLTGLPLVLVLVATAGLGIATAVVLYYRVGAKERAEVPQGLDFSSWQFAGQPPSAGLKETEVPQTSAESTSTASAPEDKPGSSDNSADLGLAP